MRGLPTSVLIDRNGSEIGRVEGAATWEGARAKALLRWYVGRGAPKPADETIKATAR